MLRASSLTKHYGAHVALRSLDLQVKGGDIYCLLGANGAGKTTTINLFLNFLSPTSGQAYINDQSAQSRDAKKYISYIPENVSLYKNFTGIENLQFFSGLAGIELDDDSCRSILSSIGLPDRAIDRPVGEYSKGMRQKVGIAIAKAKKADNLLLDEPTSGLDPKSSNEFTHLLKTLSQQQVAILMTTHDLFRAKETATHIGIMKEGQLLHSVESDSLSLKELESLYLQSMEIKG